MGVVGLRARADLGKAPGKGAVPRGCGYGRTTAIRGRGPSRRAEVGSRVAAGCTDPRGLAGNEAPRGCRGHEVRRAVQLTGRCNAAQRTSPGEAPWGITGGTAVPWDVLQKGARPARDLALFRGALHLFLPRRQVLLRAGRDRLPSFAAHWAVSRMGGPPTHPPQSPGAGPPDAVAPQSPYGWPPFRAPMASAMPAKRCGMGFLTKSPAPSLGQTRLSAGSAGCSSGRICPLLEVPAGPSMRPAPARRVERGLPHSHALPSQ